MENMLIFMKKKKITTTKHYHCKYLFKQLFVIIFLGSTRIFFIYYLYRCKFFSIFIFIQSKLRVYAKHFLNNHNEYD